MRKATEGEGKGEGERPVGKATPVFWAGLCYWYLISLTKQPVAWILPCFPEEKPFQSFCIFCRTISSIFWRTDWRAIWAHGLSGADTARLLLCVSLDALSVAVLSTH